MNVYYVTQVFKQGINIKCLFPNYILELRKTKLFQVYLGEWVKIEFVIENHVYLSVGHLLSWFSSAILVHII